MLFKQTFHNAIVAGRLRLSFRLWPSAQVKAGHRYKVPPIGYIEVDEVSLVPLCGIPDCEAQDAGFADTAALRDYIGRTAKLPVGANTMVFRVAFHFDGSAANNMPPVLDAGAIDERLDRLDRSARCGPWTRRTLDAIARAESVSSAVLAQRLDRARLDLKRDVRKLGKLGLVRSLEVGYAITSAGRAALARSIDDIGSSS
jgi:hypothetical protein